MRRLRCCSAVVALILVGCTGEVDPSGEAPPGQQAPTQEPGQTPPGQAPGETPPPGQTPGTTPPSGQTPGTTPPTNNPPTTGGGDPTIPPVGGGDPTTNPPGVMQPGDPMPVTPGDGFVRLPNGRGGFNVEAVLWTEGNIDKAASLTAFETTVYPLVRSYCSACHSTEVQRADGAQAPIHADGDVKLAHEYALTRVNFRRPEDSKLVVRMGIDRHNCFGASCKEANTKMLDAVKAWAAAVTPTLSATPRTMPQGTMVTETQVNDWIAADKQQLAAGDAEYIKYTSLHVLHNNGSTAEDLNTVRVAISKALNSVARWAPRIVNPVEVPGSNGLVYKFDTRAYWGHNKGVQKLIFGGSDDDLFFGNNKKTYTGEAVNSAVLNQKYNFATTVTEDPAHAQLIWERVLAGNVEGAVQSGTIPPYVDGFKDGYVEAAQLVYTLTRPDVYNSIMMLPWYATELESELGVVKDKGAESYQWVVTKQAITVDSRIYFRAKSRDGYYWKTFDIFTGQLPQRDIIAAEAAGNYRFPFWQYPIPKFIAGTGGGVTSQSYSFIATLAQSTNPPEGCEGQTNFGGSNFVNCRWFTGESGLQQSAEEVIFSLPNGLQGYWLGGGFNQRRVDAFVNIVRDPRIVRDATDAQIATQLDFATPDRRLNNGSSCIGCHADGMNRGTNDLRDWLDEGGARLPKGPRGVDSWINDEAVKEHVRRLYPPSKEIRAQMEADRIPFLTAMGTIKQAMIQGTDKNVFVEPIIWTVEWAQGHYKYPQTRSN